MIARRRGARWARRRRVDATLVVVSLTIASTQASWAVIVPVLPVYTERFGTGGLELGLVVALFGVGRLLANIPAGLLCRVWDPRKLLVFSALGVVACLVTTAFVATLPALLVLRTLTGLAGGVAITSGMTLMSLLATAGSRGAAMSLLQSMQLIGASLGAMLGGIAYTLWGAKAPFLLSGVVAVAVVAIGTPALFRRPLRRADHDGYVGRGAEAAVGPQLRNRSFAALCSTCAAVFFHRFGGMHAVLPLVAYTVFSLSVAEYGILQGVVSLLGLLVAVPAGMYSDRVGRKVVIVTGLALGGAGLPLVVATDHVWIFVAVMTVTSVSVSVSGPVQSAYLADITPARSMGPAVGVFRSFGDLAGIIGPLALGVVVDHAGLETAVLVLAATLLLAATSFALTAREATDRRSSQLARARRV